MTTDPLMHDPSVRLTDHRKLIVASNRQPFRHYREDGEIAVGRPIGGVSQALDTVLQRNGGTWIAWGDGEADRATVGPDDCVRVPPGDPHYTLKRIWLTDSQVDGYYYGFANEVLWPVCHSGIFTINAESHYWEAYRDVNRIFAQAIAARANRRAIIWLQDYHLALAPRMLRQTISNRVPIAHFWHIPWPAWDVFRACPHASEMLRGLLGNDLLGFQTSRYRDNFLDCVAQHLDDVSVDWHAGRVYWDGSTTVTTANPIGVLSEQRLSQADVDARWERFKRRYDLDGERVAVGVDRLDYTKGIRERLLALKRFWELHPEWRGQFTYVNIASESRSKIEAYRDIQRQVSELVDEINNEFGTKDWRPIIYTTRTVPEAELYALYQHSHVALVTPHRDGMNLVAQEYIAAQREKAGVLVLGEGAGIHDRLGEFTVSVNPHEIEEFAEAIRGALIMPRAEREHRMQALRKRVTENDIWSWVSRNLAEIVDAHRVVN